MHLTSRKDEKKLTWLVRGPFGEVRREAEDLRCPELAQSRQHDGVVMAARHHGMQAYLLHNFCMHQLPAQLQSFAEYLVALVSILC